MSREMTARVYVLTPWPRARLHSPVAATSCPPSSEQLAHTEDTHKRALEYVERVRVIGIGKLVASMDTGRRRRFFSGAIRSLTLDGKGRGVWRKRWVQSDELTDPLDTFISRRASACASRTCMFVLARTLTLRHRE